MAAPFLPDAIEDAHGRVEQLADARAPRYRNADSGKRPQEFK